MEILVNGNEINLLECRAKFGETHHYQFTDSRSLIEKLLKPESIVFDFLTSNQSEQVQAYENFGGIIFLDVSKIPLEQMVSSIKTNAICFGFSGLPTFLNREILEVSISKRSNQMILEEVCEKLKTKFAVVKDQVGLVTARVICMIINEAYFAVEENIASREDIDLAMKLGTNYPFGPFEWCEKIGIKNVYDLLSAVYESTKDERYRVCDLLKEEVNHVTQRR
jgi:3-hydroxybutyryl-CoA dehydrogenase